LTKARSNRDRLKAVEFAFQALIEARQNIAKVESGALRAGLDTVANAAVNADHALLGEQRTLNAERDRLEALL
jgi:hypothetical protein